MAAASYLPPERDIDELRNSCLALQSGVDVNRLIDRVSDIVLDFADDEKPEIMPNDLTIKLMASMTDLKGARILWPEIRQGQRYHVHYRLLRLVVEWLLRRRVTMDGTSRGAGVLVEPHKLWLRHCGPADSQQLAPTTALVQLH